MTDNERFLDRWSRRKTAARTETKDETPAAAEPVSTAAPPAGSPDTPPAIDPESLPDIDNMDADSDFSVFLQNGVPEALRSRALRKLWQTDPAFNVVDGLLEYGEDYTDIAAIVETVQSVYKVGKGMVDESAPAGQTDMAEGFEHAEPAEGITPDTMTEQDDRRPPDDLSEDNSAATDKDNHG